MSAYLDDCLKYIFGLSRSTCECNEDGKPNDYNTSDSGIYLDELPGLSLDMFKFAKDCSSESIWQKMIEARAQAVDDFKALLIQCIGQNAKLKRKPFTGMVGQFNKFSKDLTISSTYAAIKFRMADIIGGYSRLKRIGMLFNSNGSYDLKLFNNIEEDPIAEWNDVPTTAGRIAWFDLPSELSLDMNSIYSPYLEYYLVYTNNVNNKPKDMWTHCNTCGSSFRPYWNDANPPYNMIGEKGNHGWAEWMMVTGIHGSDLSKINEWGSSNYLNGLALDIVFGCRLDKTICNGELDYQGNPYALAMAYAIRARAGSILLQNILSTENPNYYTTVGSELLVQLRDQYQKKFEANTRDYICVEMTDPSMLNENSDCFTCKDENGFFRTTIRN